MTEHRCHPEADIQRAVVHLLRAVLPFGSIVQACNHEVRGSSDWARRQQAMAASMGAHPGFSDLIALLPSVDGRPGAVLFFEVKSGTGRPTERQQRFAAAVEGMRHRYFVVRSVDEALAAVQAAGVPMRARVWL
ncbi:MAG: VRR-NUC domain-containing protein [Gemmobacter sp.]|uniref:VRR-NUC domain-containing protein n=1 Tax=Gemmobacter sp. TaxID=1898957 RepID=UPI00391BB145